MHYKNFGNTEYKISRIGFGAWAIGGTWGVVDDEESYRVLNRAVDLGIIFFDTADVYGDGRSERLIGKLKRERPESLFVATKAGRRLSPHTAAGYNKDNLNSFVERSLTNLGVERIDLLQLHCPPIEVYYNPYIFEILDKMVCAGKIRNYGVSVEKVEEGLKAIEFPGVQSVQIIFNMFRQRPAELFFAEAAKRNVSVIVRVPLASGLLTGKMNSETTFAPDDHRNFNRHGEEFDVGETFSGVDYQTGLRAVEELKAVCPLGMTLAQFALKWILSFDSVTTVIPGAKHIEQLEDNAGTDDLPELSENTIKSVEDIYRKYVKEQVHHRW